MCDILQVCVVPTSGGVEHHVLSVARALSRERDVLIAAADGGWLAEAASREGLRVETIPAPVGNFDMRTLRALRAVIRARRPRIVHSHLGRSDWYAWLAAAGDRGIRLVSTEHGISADRPELFVRGRRRSLHESAHRRRLSRTDAVVAVSQATAAALVERYPLLVEHPPIVIGPGLDGERLFEIPREPRERNAPLRVVSLSRLAPEKGADLGIRALATLVARGVDASLTVAGTGPDARELEELSAALGVGSLVELPGHVQDVSAILAEGDVFLLLSRSENLPIALLEGMAAGLPVVAARVGGVPEAVSDGEEGVLVEPEDTDAAADALEALATDEPRRCEMGRAARRRAHEFDMAHTARRLGQLYDSLR